MFDENPHVRKATEEWLAQHGYSFLDEVILSDGGKADYVGRKSGSRDLIAECKSSTNKLRDTISQICQYGRVYPHPADMALFVPSYSVKPCHIKRCKAHGILLVPLDVPQPYPPMPSMHPILAEKTVSDLIAKKSSWGVMKPEIIGVIVALPCKASLAFVSNRLNRYEQMRKIVYELVSFGTIKADLVADILFDLIDLDDEEITTEYLSRKAREAGKMEVLYAIACEVLA